MRGGQGRDQVDVEKLVVLDHIVANHDGLKGGRAPSLAVLHQTLLKNRRQHRIEHIADLLDYQSVSHADA